MQKLRVGFVGAGFIAQFQMKAMAQVREMSLAGIVKRNGAEKLAAMAEEMGLGPTRIFSSITEMASHVDAIAIYSPNHTRVAVMEEIVAAKRSGAKVIGVICDKPLG